MVPKDPDSLEGGDPADALESQVGEDEEPDEVEVPVPDAPVDSELVGDVTQLYL
ncbi:MAG: hypothetical protein JNJ60_22110, partial [Rhodocyclaceae bacterium]|nr:hypothetical protein [Rhodocyclaceae bacterium]